MKKVVLFGAGAIGRQVLDWLGTERVHCFLDNDPKRVGAPCCGKPVLSPEEFAAQKEDYILLVTTAAAGQLLALGLTPALLITETLSESARQQLPQLLAAIKVAKDAAATRNGTTAPTGDAPVRFYLCGDKLNHAPLLCPEIFDCLIARDGGGVPRGKR